MRLPTLTGEFRLTDDPELRFTPSGKAVANVTLIASESRKNDAGEWEDGDRSPFIRAAVWSQNGGSQAEDVAEMFSKGERVLVTGQLYAREYERHDGSKGQSIELKWPTIGAVPGGKPRGQGGGNSRPPQGQQQRPQQQANDPWGTPAPAGGNDPWAVPQTDEPPF